ncbi:hypothetical protein P5G50_18430 [Leifsonia sp. F6_8S_P_1B]|uniref:Uncharacterized protein n=1 Tax=Leifsonia williamsii TaxID=3035919 RepID=A0ABT8KG32_9MICO|nr:hypothetical protein [Leifsonia williamsii]MDN4616429.1 hypothetical protein [Leifsonia williamsii]
MTDSRVVIKGLHQVDAEALASVFREEFPELTITVKTKKKGKK